jgi:hypothetical protein
MRNKAPRDPHEGVLCQILGDRAVSGEEVGQSERVVDVAPAKALELAALHPDRFDVGHPHVLLPWIERLAGGFCC